MGAGHDPWRLLVDPPADAAWNMAVDEAVLDAAAGDGSRPVTLRLYGWSPPTLSLGKNQPAEGSFDAGYLQSEGIDLTRRPTGGGAVLHEHERTYALIAPLGSEPFPGAVLDSYRRISRALVLAMETLGVEAQAAEPKPGRAPSSLEAACFAQTASYEIAAGERKLIGSAQLRRRRAFLQHGSILITAEAERLARALGAPSIGDRFTDLKRLLGEAPRPEAIDAAMTGAFERVFDVRLTPGTLTAGEREHAVRLYTWKYASLAWVLDGRIGERERRWGPPL